MVGLRRGHHPKTMLKRSIEGSNMPEKNSSERVAETFAKLADSALSLDGVKKIAAWHIETNEKLAKQAIELQEKGSEWAKNTPLAPFLEMQTLIASKLVERSATAARDLWQIPQPEVEQN